MSAADKNHSDTSGLIKDLVNDLDWEGSEDFPSKLIEEVKILPIDIQIEVVNRLLDRWTIYTDEAERKKLKTAITGIWSAGWQTRPQAVLDMVLEALKKGDQDQDINKYMEARQAAANWLESNAGAIAEDDRTVRRVLDALIHSANEDPVSDVKISAWQAGKQIGEAAWETHPQAVFSSVIKALKNIEEGDDWKLRQEAADWLEEKATDIAKNDRMVIQALSVLMDSAKEDQDPVFRRRALKASKSIWDEGWEFRKQDVLDQVLKSLKMLDDDIDSEVRHTAAVWLKSNAEDIAEDDRMFEQSLDALFECANLDDDPIVNRSARDAITEIWSAGWEHLENMETKDNLDMHRLAVLNEVLKALEKENDWEVKQLAAKWLEAKAHDIAQSDRMVSDSLKALIESSINDQNAHYQRSAWEATREIWEAGWEKREVQTQFFRQVVLEQVLYALRKCGDENHSEIRQTASNWLGKKANDIAKDEIMMKDALSVLIDSAQQDNVDYVRKSAWNASRKIWEAGWELDDGDNDQQQYVLAQVLAALKIGEHSDASDLTASDSAAEIRSASAEWLGGKAEKIATNNRMVNQTMKALIGRLTKDGERIEVRRSAWEACKKVWNKGWREDLVTRKTIFSSFLKALKGSDEAEIRQAAADWLGDKASEIAQDDSMINQANKELIRRVNRDSSIDVKRSAWEVSKKIWDAVPIESKQRLAILSQSLTVFNKSKDLEFRQATANWLGDKAGEIAKDYDMTEKATEALDKIRKSDNVEEELAESANRSLIALWEALHNEGEYDLGKIKKDFEVESENQKIIIIRKLANKNTLGSRDAVAFLVTNWVDWICNEEEPRLVELTAEALRENEHAVLPLVENFIKNWDATQKDFRSNLREAIRGEAKISIFSQKELDEEKQQDDKLRVRQRIAKQLADMSDPRFFDTPELNFKYESILQELQDHAVPALVRRLPEEKDVEILENMARTLLYTREREAIDALLKEIVGEERTRKARQDLLAQYYLEPSKKRSEQAADILSKAVQASKRTLRLLQFLNITVVVVGLAVLFLGVLLAMLGDSTANRVLGGLAAIGGLTGVVYQLIRDPLNRIQNANSKLVQMETAFTSFIWELNLNGTFIQSSYVENGVLDDGEIKATLDRIDNAMELTMKLVSIYTEDGRQRLVTRINKLEPAAGDRGSTITIHGQHLQGDKIQKTTPTGRISINQEDEPAGIIAINHAPINGSRTTWDSNHVEFKMPETVNGKPLHETVWVSLFVDGMETNALPFRVSESGSPLSD